MPKWTILPDVRLPAAARVQTYAYHEPVGDWVAFESRDEGATWTQTDDPTVPYNWPGNQPRGEDGTDGAGVAGRNLSVRRLGGLGVLARGAEG